MHCSEIFIGALLPLTNSFSVGTCHMYLHCCRSCSYWHVTTPCRFQWLHCTDLLSFLPFSTIHLQMALAIPPTTTPKRRGFQLWLHGVKEEIRCSWKDHGITGHLGTWFSKKKERKNLHLQTPYFHPILSINFINLACNLRRALERSGKDHTILLVLPSGVYHYRIIVDEELRYIPELPHATDERGQVANLLDVHVSKDAIFLFRHSNLWKFK